MCDVSGAGPGSTHISDRILYIKLPICSQTIHLRLYAGNGDYIEWRTMNGTDYDRAYDVFLDNNLLEIQANEVEENGRVKDPNHFNDSEWHCWDSSKFSIDC